ncbi:MAG: 30S ribosomal protein S8 [Nanoarchaeota archaeon]|nr:30S ribosomal protein S8 [Nanoarchaeota archaeon]
MTDTLSDAINTIKIARKTGKAVCVLKPFSKLLVNVLGILQKNGYIEKYEMISDSRGGFIRVTLNDSLNECKTIKPRISVRFEDLQRYEKRFLPALNFGLLILSTSSGVMTNIDARKNHVGGRLLLYVY